MAEEKAGKPEIDTDWPKEIQLSKKVRAIVGYNDNRVQLYVSNPLPLLPDIPLSLDVEDIPKVEEVIRHAKAWKSMPDHIRDFLGKE